MKKKLFLLLVALLAADIVTKADGVVFGFSPQTLQAENLSAVGTGESNNVKVAIGLDPQTDPVVARLKGKRIKGVRVFMRSAYASSQRASDRYVFCSTGSFDNIIQKSLCKFQEGWNEVDFASPVAIDDEALYIGASAYETMGNPYPFALYLGAVAKNGYFVNVHGEGWGARTTGVLLLQAILEDDADLTSSDGLLSASAHVSFSGAPLTVRPGAPMSGQLYVHNQSAQPLRRLTVKVTDEAQASNVFTVDFSADSLLLPFDGRKLPFEVPAPSVCGSSQQLSFSVTGVETEDGSLLDATGRSISFEDEYHVMLDAFTRVPLVEEFTSQRCVNCPFMSYYLDRAIEQWRKAGNGLVYVTHHSGFVDDSFTQPCDEDLTWFFGNGQDTYNPAVMYDRRVFSGNEVPVMSATVSETTPYTEAITAVSQVAAMAEINVSQSADGREVTVSGIVNRDFVLEGIPLYLTCYLIEDGIPTDDFHQEGLDDFEDAPEDLAETFRHNGVIRHVFTSDAFGDLLEPLLVDDSYTFSLTYPYPDELSPLPILNPENTDIVAFITIRDTEDMTANYVLNSGSLSLTEGTLGIAGIKNLPASTTRKYIHDGKLVIEKNGQKFTVSGQRTFL